MGDAGQQARVGGPGIESGASPRRGRSPAVSYLVRFWLEPRESAGAVAPVRGYSRDLQTGEERYFSDPRRLGEHILRCLRAGREQAEEGVPARAKGTAG